MHHFNLCHGNSVLPLGNCVTSFLPSCFSLLLFFLSVALVLDILGLLVNKKHIHIIRIPIYTINHALIIEIKLRPHSQLFLSQKMR